MLSLELSLVILEIPHCPAVPLTRFFLHVRAFQKVVFVAAGGVHVSFTPLVSLTPQTGVGSHSKRNTSFSCLANVLADKLILRTYRLLDYD